METVERIRAVPLFSDLRQQELEKLAPIIRRERHPAGVRIFSEGEPGRSMYILVSGKVRISRHPPGLGEEALAILGAGAVFGEMAVLDGAPRSADAMVHESAEVLVVDRDDLEGLFRGDFELAYHVLSAMLRTVAGRLREMNEKLMTVFMMARFC
ncbi:MAG: cyclic nucleotide-binding domain-containing protein [Thermoanaerobaculaceae bacterium]|jgi:CRP-like cAMP-binding protein|nr:cyclic nucleotide-binding domain-containing protein [Thermoanaerobaculaceae bacterium]